MEAKFTSGDFPANPRERAGYRLEFHDEFNREGLDTENWLPFHLPQRSSRAHQKYLTVSDPCVFGAWREIFSFSSGASIYTPVIVGVSRCSDRLESVPPVD